MGRVCSVQGCDRKHSAKGFCNIHYQRHLGGIATNGNKKPTLEERIMSKTIKLKNGCWLWTGAKSGGNGTEKYKYGYINVSGKIKRVHRVLYEITNNIVLDKKHLLHRCDNPACVNPEHMFVGNHQDNMNDMISKKRDYHPKGELNHSKLTEKQVLKIRAMAKNGDSSTLLSIQFGVHVSTIRGIVTRKKWKHI